MGRNHGNENCCSHFLAFRSIILDNTGVSAKSCRVCIALAYDKCVIVSYWGPVQDQLVGRPPGSERACCDARPLEAGSRNWCVSPLGDVITGGIPLIASGGAPLQGRRYGSIY